jgi:uncharacterized protein
MRFAVEPWAPEYGTAVGPGDVEPTKVPVEVHHEVAPDDWRPLRPPAAAEPAGRVRFIDGVRRVDAWVWVTDDDGSVHPGIAASYAAGSVSCATLFGTSLTRQPGAWLEQAVVRRRVLSPARSLAAVATRHGSYEPCQTGGEGVEALSQELQQQMGLLEQRLAVEGAPADLIVVDGPLSKLPAIGETVGYVKTRHRQYLPEALDRVTATLDAGERTPLFRTMAGWQRWSWYLRLPGPLGHPLAGVVRCEVAGEVPLTRARALADTVAATLPRFASRPHRDPRAPQNLTPIGALERALRHRLGNAQLMERALRSAAAGDRSASAGRAPHSGAVGEGRGRSGATGGGRGGSAGTTDGDRGAWAGDRDAGTGGEEAVALWPPQHALSWSTGAYGGEPA